MYPSLSRLRLRSPLWRCVSSVHSHPYSHFSTLPGKRPLHKWESSVVRSTFIDYFTQEKGHVFHASSPVVPHGDPSLLFANAGMNQFKPLFLGTADPSSPLAQLSCAVNSQKCIRAGGKHNDLADVGKDTYHHTFFEMLGTWSFNGAYSQREAIDWAFDLLTRPGLYGLDPNRLYVSYFGGDPACGLEEDRATRDAWLRHLPSDRVLPFRGVSGENFWEMGDTGPCGPCTEIHYDRIGSRNAAHLVNADDPNVLEIWNLVFMQYNRPQAGAALLPLPALHIDTGMGLERLTSILQQKTSNYDTDIFMPLLDAVHAEFRLPNMTGTGMVAMDSSHQLPPYGFSEYQSATDFSAQHGSRPTEWQLQEKQLQQRDLAYRVIADHLRTASIAIADGTQLSSGGRGYVIRRVLRRALRYAQLLNKEALSIAELQSSHSHSHSHSQIHRGTPQNSNSNSSPTSPSHVSSSQTKTGTVLPGHDVEAVGRPPLRNTAGADPRMSSIIPTIVHQLGDFYPELKVSEEKIMDIIRDEEKSFAVLLNRGVKFLDDKMGEMADAAGTQQGTEDRDRDSEMAMAMELVISGDDVFYLYDTLGFPVDLTELIVEEHNEQSTNSRSRAHFCLDLVGYEAAMCAQKERAARAHTRHKQVLMGLEGGVTLSPSISALHSLRQGQVPATDDSFKFFLPSTARAGNATPTSTSTPASALVQESRGTESRNSNGIAATVLKVFTNENAFQNTLTLADAREEGVFGLLLDRTVFYAEGGGQVADTGVIRITRTGVSGSVTASVIDVQAYGEHILHTCVLLPASSSGDSVMTSGADLIREGAHCELQVDEARRDGIVPNHTMTHVLNAVLRDVLQSDTIDQKGSLVSAEKMRFDFSYDKALSLPLVQLIEDRVNAAIAADLAVHTATVPLNTAQRLPGVRAVFGEHYPDPVRVVCVGGSPSGDDCLDNLVRGAAEVTEGVGGSVGSGAEVLSIEFCGGTHLRSTGQALGWVVLEETAVAKGVRRLVAVTGDTAVRAQEQAKILAERSSVLTQQITAFVLTAHQQLSSSTHTRAHVPTMSSLDCGVVKDKNDLGRRLEELQVELNVLKDVVERADISITVSIPLRKQFQQCQKELIGCRKKYVAAAVEESIISLVAQSKHALGAATSPPLHRPPSPSCAVLEMRLPPHVSCDAGVMKTVTQRLQAETSPNFCFLVLCPDHPKAKLRCFASVPSSVITNEPELSSSSLPVSLGWSAARWVQAVTGALGGKSGGKDSSAQGSVDMDMSDRSIDRDRERDMSDGTQSESGSGGSSSISISSSSSKNNNSSDSSDDDGGDGGGGSVVGTEEIWEADYRIALEQAKLYMQSRLLE